MGKWCCEIFSVSIEKCGDKGFSIAAFRHDSHRTFYILGSLFEREFNTQIGNAKNEKFPILMDNDGTEIPMTTIVYQPILFCPFCGENLDDLIDKDESSFDKLADRHAEFF